MEGGRAACGRGGSPQWRTTVAAPSSPPIHGSRFAAAPRSCAADEARAQKEECRGGSGVRGGGEVGGGQGAPSPPPPTQSHRPVPAADTRHAPSTTNCPRVLVCTVHTYSTLHAVSWGRGGSPRSSWWVASLASSSLPRGLEPGQPQPESLVAPWGMRGGGELGEGDTAQLHVLTAPPR